MEPYDDNTVLYSHYSVPILPKNCETWRPHTVGEFKKLCRNVKPLPEFGDSYYIYPKRKVQVNTTVYYKEDYIKKYITDIYGKNERFFVYMAATGKQFLEWYENKMKNRYCIGELSIKSMSYSVGSKSLLDVGKDTYIRYWVANVLKNVYPDVYKRREYLDDIHDAYGHDVVLKLYVDIELENSSN